MKILLLLVSVCIYFNGIAQLSFVPSTYTVFNPTQYYLTPTKEYIGINKKIRNVSGSNWNKYRFSVTILKYDAQMNKVKESTLSNGEGVYSAFYTDFKQTGNKCWLVYAEPASGNSIGNIRGVEIDMLTLIPGETKILASENQIDEKLKLLDGLSGLKINLESSPNKKRHCLYVDNGKDEFYLSCLDEQFNPIWNSKQIIEGYKQDNIKTISVDDDGNIFIVSNKKSSSLISMYDARGKVTNKELDFGSLKPTDIKIVASKLTSNLTVAGVFTEQTDNIIGVYKANLNKKTLMLENISKTLFTETIMERLKKDGFASTKTKSYGITPSEISCKMYVTNDENVKMIIECKQRLGTDRMTATGAGSLICVNFAGTTTFSQIPRYAVIAGPFDDDAYFALACQNKFIIF